MLLQDKVAVVYGAGGAIGGAVARAFAAEGAEVVLTGNRQEPLDAVAKEIAADGGSAQTAVVDALDGQAIDEHLRALVDRTGRIDISFNAIGLPDAEVVGVALANLDAERFARPITAYTTSYFLTASAAARQMVPNRKGVIMTVSALPARTGTNLNGGYGPAQAAKEAMTRDLSAELAPQGIRVVGLRPHGIPETSTMREVLEARGAPMPFEQFEQFLASTTHPRRAMTLDDTAQMAAFVASDRASGMTGTTVNLTMGSLDD